MLPSIFGESLFDDWMGFPFRDFTSDADRKLYGRHAAHVMKTDLKEHDEGYELSVDLPGFKKEQIDLQLQNGYLTITASKGLEEEGQDNYQHVPAEELTKFEFAEDRGDALRQRQELHGTGVGAGQLRHGAARGGILDDQADQRGDNDADVIGWTGTKWNFSGTLTVNDTDEPGPYTDNISMTIEFPESGGVKISGGGDLSDLAGSSKVRFEETVNSMIITISGSSRDTSDGLDTVNWAYTLTLNHTSATQAVMSWNGQESYSGWYYVGKDKKTYSGAISTSGQFTGTRTK